MGVGLRLPGGVGSLDELWSALVGGCDLVTEVPSDRFGAAYFLDEAQNRPGKTYTVAGGFLNDATGFDADYFGISPKEASRVDPQHRLLLECAVEAFDDAGIDPSTLAGSDAAVIMGLSSRDYGDLQGRRVRTFTAYNMAGAASCNAANRVSYFFDFQGPSFAVDTACSSTLTAVHEACAALRSGRSALALAGAANVLLSPHGYIGGAQASMLSPTGRCHPFSARADGYVRAEGAGVFLLKPLRAAVADGDRVHGVIVGSAVNSDGHTAGLSMPNPAAQARLLERAYGAADVEPGDVDYVEAHGTGTKAGDPVECAALGKVLGARRRAGPLPIGSVKSNVGHLEAAAGVAGLCKALLVLRERWIPQTLHSEPVNPDIDFARLGLEPVTRARSLEVSGRCVIGVNSFGFGGANAHVVLTTAPGMPATATAAEPVMSLPVVVSAKTPLAVATAANRLADELTGAAADGDPADSAAAFYDVAYTTSRRRARHRHQFALLATGAGEAAARLRSLAQREPVAGGAAASVVERGTVGFVFAGNGALWVGAGASLLASDAAFAAEVEAVDDVLTSLLGWSVRDELAHPGDPDRWERTEVAQPLLFTVQAGLVAALAARGVVPSAAIGHSVGEVAAAYCAGLLDREGACRVIAERSLAQAPTRGPGRMAAVGLSARDAEQRLRDAGLADRVVLACINSDQDVTVSGDGDVLTTWGAELAEQGVFYRELKLAYAFHSPAMDTARAALFDGLADLPVGEARIPMHSTVTGSATEGPLDVEYWWRNIREPVQFADAIAEMTRPHGCDVLVEIGPHPVLKAYLRRNADQCAHPVAIAATMTRTHAGAAALQATLVELLAAGADIDASPYFPVPGRVVSLPAYPWQRERHWNGHPDWWLEGSVAEASARPHPLLGARQPAAEPAWQQSIEPGRLPWLADHKVGETVVMPAAAYVDMALSAAGALWDGPVELTGLTISSALVLPLDDPSMDVRTHTQMSADGSFTISSRTGEQADWRTHVRGRARRLLRTPPAVLNLDGVGTRLTREIDVAEHYAKCTAIGLSYGPTFQTLGRLRTGNGETLAAVRLAVPGGTSGTTDPGDECHQVHPALLDGALQAILPSAADTGVDSGPHVPVGIATVRCWRPMSPTGRVHVRPSALDTAVGSGQRWDVTVTDDGGEVAVELVGVHLRRLDDRAVRPVPRLTEVLRATPLEGTVAAPSPLPAPSRVRAACAGELAALSGRWRADDYAGLQRAVLAVTAHFAATAVREVLPDGDTFTLGDLLAAGVDDTYLTFLGHLLGLATAHGLVTEAGQGAWRHLAQPLPDEKFRDMVWDFPADSTYVEAVGVCGRHLAAVLCGQQDPLELIFSDSDTLAARIYDSLSILVYHYQMARTLFRAAVADWPRNRPLRVLELGAGTGATTEILLPELPPERTHFTYTDISPAFFAAAKDRFGRYDFIDYRPLDLNADPTAQGFTPGSFDLVIASNVLHTAGDLATTMRWVADLLADDGHLLAVEITNVRATISVFGLLDSYWPAADTDLRPDGPTLTRQTWSLLLDECGFDDIVHTGDEREPARGDCTVMLAARRARGATAGRPPSPEGAGPPRQWLVTDLAEDSSGTRSISDALRERLAAQGDMVGAVTAPDDPGSWAAALARRSGPVPIVIVVNGDGDPDATPESITERAIRYCAVLRAVAAVFQEGSAQASEEVKPTVWLVAHTAELSPTSLPPGPGAAAAAWGAARCLANEQHDLGLRRVALSCRANDTESIAEAVDSLLAEVAAGSTEDEILLTPAGRFVPRLRPFEDRQADIGDGAAQPFVLSATAPGPSYRLDWRPAPQPPPPGPGEVVVAVRAVGLNYRDIMLVTGRMPTTTRQKDGTESLLLGMECAGTVIATGSGVSGPAVGDRVIALAESTLGSHTVVRADRTIPMTAGMTFAEAVTMPIAFLTVHHGLGHLARLASGETLLVHSAAGGVGLAAQQYARHVGARIIATAGTPAKRDMLRLLGVEHVLDSHNLRFADQVMELTGGQGVDVVLNSLAGEGLTRGLDILKPHGRFVELGKQDILADNPLPLSAFARNISFFAEDVFSMFIEGSPLTDRHLSALAQAIEDGRYRPLPYRPYPATRIREAFTHLQQSRHIGKVVVTFDEPLPVRPSPERIELRPDAAYLITGGLSGLGAATARLLVTSGARHLALVSRRGEQAPEAAELLTDLRAQGATVDAYAADAADQEAMERILDLVQSGGHQLAGIVHAAMVLDDAALTELSDDRIRAVLVPKMTAGYLLHQLTRKLDLDFFVVYSSLSAAIGNVRQAPYSAGNLALEAMVKQRRRAGLPALSIRWGAIADTGYIHRNDIIDSLTTLGMTLFSVDKAMASLSELMADSRAEIVTAAIVDWGRIATFLPTLAAPRTAELLPLPDEVRMAEDPRHVAATASEEEALAAIEDFLAQLLAGVTQTTPERVARDRRLDLLGVDSLMSTEIMTKIQQAFGCAIPAMEITGAANLAALAKRVRRATAKATGNDAPAASPAE